MKDDVNNEDVADDDEEEADDEAAVELDDFDVVAVDEVLDEVEVDADPNADPDPDADADVDDEDEVDAPRFGVVDDGGGLDCNEYMTSRKVIFILSFIAL